MSEDMLNTLEDSDIGIPAATVILIRQQLGDLQVYLLKRSPQSRFMAGNYVFPGGVVGKDDCDQDFWIQYAEQTVTDGPDSLGTEMSLADALTYRITAIRETFEEAGVLLIGSKARPPSGLAQVCEMRFENDLTSGWLRREVQRHGWILQTSALKRWAHWITPALMPRRYDTRFFLAALPSGQECRPDDREMTHGTWITPLQALQANLRGVMPLSPPTVVTLQQLLAYNSFEEVCRRTAERSTWPPVLKPRLIPTARGPVILEPWDPEFDKPDIAINPDTLEQGLVAAGVPFSRLWNDGGVWRPVAAGT